MMVVDASGGLFAWGVNGMSQLGDTTTVDKSTPSIVNGGSLAGETFVSVSCGESHTMAVDINGTLHAWGDNTHGQLGMTPG